MKKVKNSGGGGLMKRYTSLGALLRAVYPDFDWDSTKFFTAGRAQFGHWKNKDNLFKALDRAEEQLGITQVFTTHNNISLTKELRVVVYVCRWRIGILYI